MTLSEIKHRQLTNQHLTEKAPLLTAAHDLCGFQAQFFKNSVHALKIRCSDFSEDKTKNELLKSWSLRGTVHLFAKDDAPLFIHCQNCANYKLNEWHEPSF